MVNKARYCASHPFVAGSPDQLSFSAGAVLLVELERQHGGWVWAHLEGQKRKGGWAPLSYLVPGAPSAVPMQQQETPNSIALWSTPQPQTATTASGNSTNPFDDTDYRNDSGGFGGVASNPTNPFDDGNNDDGFGGAAMGGEWTSSKDVPAHTGTSVCPNQSTSNAVPTAPNESRTNKLRGFGGKLGSGWKGVGASLHQAGKNASSSIRTGTKKAAVACGRATAETKHRVKDMTQKQRQQESTGTIPEQQQQNATTTPTKQECRQRTQGEQMQLNAANGAARGALVGGAVGFAMSGGNVTRAASNATTHGVYGGAYGAARNWKPFGN